MLVIGVYGRLQDDGTFSSDVSGVILVVLKVFFFLRSDLHFNTPTISVTYYTGPRM